MIRFEVRITAGSHPPMEAEVRLPNDVLEHMAKSKGISVVDEADWLTHGMQALMLIVAERLKVDWQEFRDNNYAWPPLPDDGRAGVVELL